MFHHHRIRLIVLLILAAAAAVWIAPAARAQCPIPAGWGPYTVVRGDTLYGIARRLGIRLNELSSGNCLSNTRLRAGQTLYVPASSPTQLRVNYQRFERGLILWRSDDSSILVLVDTGAVRSFTGPRYSTLPENPQPLPPPGDSRRPAFGIGKVWGNFREVRDLVGQPTTGESSYPALSAPAPNGIYLTHPDGQPLLISGSTWVFAPAIVPTQPSRILGTPMPTATLPREQAAPTATPKNALATRTADISTWAAYQPFENGFMLWRQDTNEVYVFDGYAGSSTVVPYSAAIYDAWPIPSDVPPSGRFTPINAFGKVWSQLGGRLGWGTAAEQGFTASIQNYAQQSMIYSHITLPNGRTAFVNIGRLAWSWLN